MRQVLTLIGKRVKGTHIPDRRPRRYQPRCSVLEDRCLLSVTLTLSEATSALVGAPVTWTASSSGDGASPVYQFSVTPPGGPTQMVQQGQRAL